MLVHHIPRCDRRRTPVPELCWRSPLRGVLDCPGLSPPKGLPSSLGLCFLSSGRSLRVLVLFFDILPVFSIVDEGSRVERYSVNRRCILDPVFFYPDRFLVWSILHGRGRPICAVVCGFSRS